MLYENLDWVNATGQNECNGVEWRSVWGKICLNWTETDTKITNLSSYLITLTILLEICDVYKFKLNENQQPCKKFLKNPPPCMNLMTKPAATNIRSDQSLSRVRLFATPWIAARQASLPSPTPRVHWDSRPSSQWCHPAISSSVVPFSSCPQSLPASESFPMSQLFSWGGQSTRDSVNIKNL